jgi:RNA-directed DNA polymerase
MNATQKIAKMKPIGIRWVNYFWIAKVKSIMQELDECVRTRLRMGHWKEWKSCKTRVSQLHFLKASKQKSYEWGNSSKGYYRVAHSPILCRTLNNAHFSKLG